MNLYAAMRSEISCTASKLLNVAIGTETIDIAPRGAGARCAAPLKFGADAAQWAQLLTKSAHEFLLLDEQLISSVSCNGGHLLFHFADVFYSAAVAHIINALPQAKPFSTGEAGEQMSSVFYAQRRMWMLARRATGKPFCPAVPDVQLALLSVLSLLDAPHEQALRIRAADAANALITMTYSTPPRRRPALLRDCAYVGDAAARIFSYSIKEGAII
ncbi:hypothetical protein LJC42_02560 [Eubacteriales bacterium OttesenSCG-928-K08]|nr:hypothetical protein [Eubacteriales bacterium OttesenSCG-928-K08]